MNHNTLRAVKANAHNSSSYRGDFEEALPHRSAAHRANVREDRARARRLDKALARDVSDDV